MGQDHWLNRRINIGSQYTHTNTKVNDIIVEKNGQEISFPTENVDSINYEIICWRKSNHIRKWFVDNIQVENDDCRSYYVSQENLLNFKKVLEKVIEIHEQIKSKSSTSEPERWYKEISAGHKEELEKILPVQSGFFFGSNEYGELYFNDVSWTLEELNKELIWLESNKELSVSYEYNSSW